jgi:predicted DNA-binding protein YlxM (UPF0122 family)
MQGIANEWNISKGSVMRIIKTQIDELLQMEEPIQVTIECE